MYEVMLFLNIVSLATAAGVTAGSLLNLSHELGELDRMKRGSGQL